MTRPASRSTSLSSRIEAWFLRHQRRLPWRETYEPYEVWISEVMLQQTRMETVLGYYGRFVERFPTVHALAAASEHDVLAQWSGLGYYRRAKMLRQGAMAIVERFDGRIPATVDELLTVPGIGRYTAGAIASIAHDGRAPIVDGNVARIAARLFTIDAPLGSPALMKDAWQRAQQLVDEADSPRALNQGLMELGALVCTPRQPACLVCPLHADCAARIAGRVGELPRPKAKQATRELRIALYVVRDRRGRVLMRRESGPLMNAMFHLPHDSTLLFDDAPLPVLDAKALGTFRHTVTNRRITFEVATASLPSKPRGEAYVWIAEEELGGVPHPSYVKKALRLASAK